MIAGASTVVGVLRATSGLVEGVLRYPRRRVLRHTSLESLTNLMYLIQQGANDPTKILPTSVSRNFLCVRPDRKQPAKTVMPSKLSLCRLGGEVCQVHPLRQPFPHSALTQTASQNSSVASISRPHNWTPTALGNQPKPALI
jgi:hypothetical protein